MLKVSDPILFVFSQDFICSIIEVELDLGFHCNQFNLGITHHKNWSKYWENNGDDIVLRTWKEKYRNFLIDETDANTDHYTNLDGDSIKDEHTKDWAILWKEHNEQIYIERSNWYNSIYQHYSYTLQNSLKQILKKRKTLNNDDQEVSTSVHIANELKELRILGLPTAFGSTQIKNKKRTFSNHQDDSFYEFLTDDEDSETEEDMMEDSEDNIIDNLDSLHSVRNEAIKKKKKNKNRKLRKLPQLIQENKNLLKYWHKRFSLFSRFDEGIRLDYESWFSVTPEKVAIHIAERLHGDIILDPFCGCGGNAIQFARMCQKVIAIDIDPLKIEMAKHNAAIYGVEHKIDFIVGDFLQIGVSCNIKCDAIFLSPPWGGPGYKNKGTYDIEKFLLPVGASELIELCRRLSENIALFLPRNSNMQQIIRLAGNGKRCEVEHNYLDTRLVAITALYGEDILCKKTIKETLLFPSKVS